MVGSYQLEATQMKLWILTAALAVVLMGGAVDAVALDDGGTSDGTVTVDTLDIDSAFVALTIDADTAEVEETDAGAGSLRHCT